MIVIQRDDRNTRVLEVFDGTLERAQERAARIRWEAALLYRRRYGSWPQPNALRVTAYAVPLTNAEDLVKSGETDVDLVAQFMREELSRPFRPSFMLEALRG